ncbi:PAS domain S-box protein [Candidatus Aminicenantes bacterium AC-335-K20]|nr:PAS domain S-box protein [SCandidatus Aminicenantes bacterium Aminicenantia_JdfR_composite]MCP2598336.1 PAS domain S-box protein [Candidatus Aminicenantes bacterium AC-335-L06]MCP2606058.1 PAS domain S-box protein [Candidatus Aminicenantes bacterium AC-708-I09]MCP2618387.1 PAS domain S-box protein [Candidatus Aminicenantes bacterium AC-335-A11]MCP2619383.1 PAS domain S-box protein [Candidatus Aminicenantes bacterium AC-335-K20]MCP2620592.1 PAS domain S-box protein [Candidatus Aminicenantes 
MRKKHKELIENLKIGVYRASAEFDGKFIEVNKALIEILGYKNKKELLKIKIKDLYRNANNRKNFIAKLRKYGYVENEEIWLKKKDGTPILCSDTAVAIFDKKGKIKYIDGFIENITSKRALEEKLRMINEIVQNMEEIVLVADKEGKIIFTNPAIEKVLGYKPEEILGDKYWLLVHPDEEDREKERKYVAGVARGEIKVRKKIYENVLKHKNGKVKWIAWRDTRMPPGYVIGVGRDVTEEKIAREELKISESKYRTLFEHSGTIIFMINKEGIITAVNNKGIEFLNLPREEIENKMNVFEFLPPEEKKRIRLIMIKRLKGENIPSEYEVNFFVKGGEKRIGRINVELVPGTQNFIVSLTDITEQKKLEQQLIQSEKIATVRQMLGGITHQLNNPLSTLMGYVEMLLNTEVSEDIKQKLMIIYENAERCGKIIKDLTNLIAGKPFEKVYMDINDLIEKTVDIKEYELKLDNIKVIKELDPSVPRIMADSSQIQQVLINLINNAQDVLRDKKDKKEIRIRTYFDEKNIYISVKDNGPGIKKELLNQIFSPFFTTYNDRSHLGLGLSVSSKIIEDHKGKITVNSELGKGAEFIIKLPITEMEDYIK